MSYLMKITAIRMSDEKDFKPECFAGSDLNVVHAGLLEGGFCKPRLGRHRRRWLRGRGEVPQTLFLNEVIKGFSENVSKKQYCKKRKVVYRASQVDCLHPEAVLVSLNQAFNLQNSLECSSIAVRKLP